MMAEDNKSQTEIMRTTDEETCVVCFRKAEIFSIGECDHPVCHECSTRMRVLCGRTECPICRKDMAMVVFTRKIQPFSTIQYRNMKCERRYSIYFASDDIMTAYDRLLEHVCSICEKNPRFKNFNLLKDHMRKIHERFYCVLCVDNLKIFTHERRCYTRALLAQHRRIGDTDDKSHRGHPLCEFCDSRFMDNDELFRHLRRDHFFCHFCDADGLHQYYDDYDALRDHFRRDHFLCEEGNCREERFTSVYRTKLDLQAHTTQTHGHTMSKSEARQARTVDIAFTVNHRQCGFSDWGRGERREGGGRGRRQQHQDKEEQMAAAASVPPSQVVSPKQQAIDINCVQDFPSLSGMGGTVAEGEGGGGGRSIANKLAQQNRFTIRTTRGHPLNEEEFPRLGATTSVSVAGGTVPASSNTHPGTAGPPIPTTSVHLSVNTKKTGGQYHGCDGTTGPNVSIQYNCTKPSFTPSSNAEPKASAFAGKEKLKPRIGAVSHSGNITVRNATSAAPKAKPATLEEEFPSLQPSSKGFPSNVQPPTASWVTNKTNASVASEKPKKTSPVNSTSAKMPPTSTSKSNNNNLFESSDFPSLAPSTESQQQKLNYSGRSSLTIPMKKAWPNNDKCLENDENSGSGKGKKKKKNVTGKGTTNAEVSKNVTDVAPTTNSSTKTSSKKKPLILSNTFNDLDSDEVVEDFSRTRLGEYESVAPTRSSNIKFVKAEDHSILKNTKKSELQIGTLKTPEFSADEFPSLGGLSLGKGPKKIDNFSSHNNDKDSEVVSPWGQPPQSSKKRPAIPPGFSKKSQSGIPPGFANTDMTFTSSLGQEFAISPTSVSPKKAESKSPKTSLPNKEKKNAKPMGFLLPPNFEQRNKALIDAISQACEANSEKFNKFKHLAEIFRSGEIKGREYYEKCRQVMGKKVFHSILPELLALLPDIEKQQAVLEAYRKVDGAQGCVTCFAVCAVCQQVLVSDDFPVHMTSHEFPPEEFSPDDFPSLNQSPSWLQRRK